MERLGYPGLFWGMVLESAGMPLPSELLLPFAGFLVQRGSFTFLGAIIASTVGGALGYLGLYFVGRYVGRPVIERWGRYAFITRADLERADAWFALHGPWAVLVARMVPVMRGLIALPAGAAHMSPLVYITYSVIGSVPWTVGLVWAGISLGSHWNTVAPYFHWLTLAVVLVLALLAIGWIVTHRRRDSITS